MPKRFWSEALNLEAAKQLNVPPDYDIFLMSCQVSTEDDEALDKVVEDYKTNGSYVEADEFSSELLNTFIHIFLPDGWRLIGMQPMEGDGVKVYGLVNFSNFGFDTENPTDERPQV